MDLSGSAVRVMHGGSCTATCLVFWGACLPDPARDHREFVPERCAAARPHDNAAAPHVQHLSCCEGSSGVVSTFCGCVKPLLTKSYRYCCGHSHCFVCIHVWLEKSWRCPECLEMMYRKPFRHWGGEA
jgi:hypothetical protein